MVLFLYLPLQTFWSPQLCHPLWFHLAIVVFTFALPFSSFHFWTIPSSLPLHFYLLIFHILHHLCFQDVIHLPFVFFDLNYSRKVDSQDLPNMLGVNEATNACQVTKLSWNQQSDKYVQFTLWFSVFLSSSCHILCPQMSVTPWMTLRREICAPISSFIWFIALSTAKSIQNRFKYLWL